MKHSIAAALLIACISSSSFTYCYQKISKKHQSFACAQHGKKCKGNHTKSHK